LTRYLLDTNIIADLIRNPQGKPAKRIAEVGEDDICTGIIVAAELRYGCTKSGSKRLLKAVEDLLGEVNVLPFDVSADAEYAGIRSELEAAGKPIGGNDLQIAAHAYAIGATIVTANTKEFKRVRGLNVQNWLDRETETPCRLRRENQAFIPVSDWDEKPRSYRGGQTGVSFRERGISKKPGTGVPPPKVHKPAKVSCGLGDLGTLGGVEVPTCILSALSGQAQAAERRENSSYDRPRFAAAAPRSNAKIAGGQEIDCDFSLGPAQIRLLFPVELVTLCLLAGTS
jgi:tRNA(fMet)-specific endonuclease VapC